jgi:AraC-like DNA-binding protein
MNDLISIGMIPEPVLQIGAHSHNVWEMVYYIYGTGSITIDNISVQFEPGAIVCLPPNIPHFEISETGYRNYHWSVQSFHGFGTGIPVFKDNESRDYRSILSQIYREYHTRQNNWRNIAESLLGVLYQYMLAWNCAGKTNSLVERFRNTLVANIANPSFSLEEALKDVPLSSDHFRKIFKKEIGRSPLEYLLQKKIDYAKELIHSNESYGYNIKEVAILCGFNDQYYFSRLFKKYTGVSPKNYQR